MVKKQSIVPIIQPDLGQEETILEIAFALDCLEKVATNIFCQVESSIEKNKQRLNNLKERCVLAQDKLSKLTGINKSITAYCTGKYPGTSRDRCYELDIKNVEIVRPNIHVKYKPLPPEKLSIKEKLKFYHMKDRTQLLKKNIEVAALEGLGGYPHDVKSVSSLLLFNTNDNIYKNYKLVDPLSYSSKPSNIEEPGEEDTEIEPAPISIGLSEETSYRYDRNLFYSPSLQNVPDIDAPMDLPHLTGIAGDLRYTLDHPSLEKSPSNTPEDYIPEDVSAIVENLPKLESTSSEESNYVAPPPPPPPPPPESLAIETKNRPLDSEPKTPTPASSDARATLMDAIRKAGGSGKAKLRSVSVTEGTATNDSREPKKSGISLMDDLHAKLSMRRKGISGKIDNPEGIMERMVSMIPPPPSKEPDVEPDDDWD